MLDSFELLRRKVFTRVKSAREVLRGFIVGLVVHFLKFFLSNLWDSSLLCFFVIVIIGGRTLVRHVVSGFTLVVIAAFAVASTSTRFLGSCLFISEKS